MMIFKTENGSGRVSKKYWVAGWVLGTHWELLIRSEKGEA